MELSSTSLFALVALVIAAMVLSLVAIVRTNQSSDTNDIPVTPTSPVVPPVETRLAAVGDSFTGSYGTPVNVTFIEELQNPILQLTTYDNGSLQPISGNVSNLSTTGFTFDVPLPKSLGAVALDGLSSISQAVIGEVGGHPVVIYTTSFSALYVRSITEQGEDGTWSKRTNSNIVSNTIRDGTHNLSMSVAPDGFPSFVVAGSANLGPLWSHASDFDAITFSVPEIQIDALADPTTQCQHVVRANGIPMTVYNKGGGTNEVRFAQGSNTTGSAWDPPQTVDTVNPATVAVAEIDGRPAVAWITGSQDVFYARHNVGGTFDTPVQVTTSGSVLDTANLHLFEVTADDGTLQPVISFVDQPAQNECQVIQASANQGQAIGDWTNLPMTLGADDTSDYHDAFLNCEGKLTVVSPRDPGPNAPPYIVPTLRYFVRQSDTVYTEFDFNDSSTTVYSGSGNTTIGACINGQTAFAYIPSQIISSPFQLLYYPTSTPTYTGNYVVTGEK